MRSELKRQHLVFLVAGLLLGGCASRPVGEPVPDAISPASKTALEARAAGAAEAGESAERGEGEGADEARSIYFGYGSSKVDVAGRAKLLALASELNRNGAGTVTLIGRADDLGSPSYILAVAGTRVDAVAGILRSYGVPRNRIVRSVRGNERLAAQCNTKACKRKMRRVEVHYLAN